MLPDLRLARFTLAVLTLSPALSAQQPAGPHRPRDVGPLADDCNANGIRDGFDVAMGTSADCNANQVPDECDVGSRVLLAESFEAGLPAGWGTFGLAHVTDQCARPTECDGPNFVYFGLDEFCDFADGNFPVGGLSLPEVEIPAPALSARMTFCSAYEGEGFDPYDSADVYVNGELKLHVSPDPQLEWETRAVNLSAYAGQSVSIFFDFVAMDSVGNNFLGWQVDNIEISAYGVGEPALDCNANGVPDECDPDCNANGTPDDCDIAAGASSDCNLNGVPDACDVASATSPDCNLNQVPDECDLALDLVASLANLEVLHPTITGHFPDTYAFAGGQEGTCLTFDSLGTFACANTLNTNLALEIPYTGSNPALGSGFGPGARYFTAKHPGLFAMVATDCSVDNFRIGGQHGLDLANANVDTLELSVNVDGQAYSIYVKRVHGNGSEVSVNQVIAIPGDGTGVTHTWAADPLQSHQLLNGLAGIDRVFYMLVCRRIPGESSPPLRPVDAQEIVRELIGMTPGPLSSDDNGNGVPDECD